MKSIQIKKYGGNEVVEVNKKASVPSISSGKILVNVKAAGVNPADWKIRDGGLATASATSIPINLGDGFFRCCQTSWGRQLYFRF
jgi:alcohol dehydrogenase